MGICSSCDATAVATAKLILHDGTLQEFVYPVKVSYLLQKYPSTFICNSDEMEFDDVVSSLHEDEMLQLGQLYFALPINRLRRKLQAEEMAALAVKASSALAKSGVYFSTPALSSNGSLKSSSRVSDVASVGSRSRRRRNFNAMLSAIPE